MLLDPYFRTKTVLLDCLSLSLLLFFTEFDEDPSLSVTGPCLLRKTQQTGNVGCFVIDGMNKIISVIGTMPHTI